MTICPCCGFRFEGDLQKGCSACGARAVGDPLPRPERELPAYGRALLLVAVGVLLALGLFVETLIALAQHPPLSFSFRSLFWSSIAAAETAAWRLKWISIPITLVVLWGGRRIYQSMLQTPDRFIGIRQARRGLMAAALVSLTVAALIGVTVPARLRQRRMRIEAGINAQAYTFARAQLEYRDLHGTFAAEINDLRELPDPDGSIAAALANIDSAAYKPTAELAEASPKQRTLPGAVLRNAALTSPAEEPPIMGGGLAVTNYDLRLPGEDKIPFTDDDLILRDGVLIKASELKESPVHAKAPTRPGKR